MNQSLDPSSLLSIEVAEAGPGFTLCTASLGELH